MQTESAPCRSREAGEETDEQTARGAERVTQ
jgi:hypothetical protein